MAQIDATEMYKVLSGWLSQTDKEDSLRLVLQHYGTPDRMAQWELQHGDERHGLVAEIIEAIERKGRKLGGYQKFLLVCKQLKTGEVVGQEPWSYQAPLASQTRGDYEMTEDANERGLLHLRMRHDDENHRVDVAARAATVDAMRRTMEALELRATRAETNLALANEQNAAYFREYQQALNQAAQRDLEVQKTKADMESKKQMWAFLAQAVMLFSPAVLLRYFSVETVTKLISAANAVGVQIAANSNALPPGGRAAPAAGPSPAAPSPAAPSPAPASASAPSTPQPAPAAPAQPAAPCDAPDAAAFIIGLRPEQEKAMLAELSVEQQLVWRELKDHPCRANVLKLVHTMTSMEQLARISQHVTEDQMILLGNALRDVSVEGPETAAAQ